jgi:hypothetical protein
MPLARIQAEPRHVELTDMPHVTFSPDEVDVLSHCIELVLDKIPDETTFRCRVAGTRTEAGALRERLRP